MQPSFQRREYDANAKQWMKEALVSRHVIDELEATNRKLQHELDRKTNTLKAMDECVSSLGASAKVKLAMEAKMASVSTSSSPVPADKTSPRRSPRKPQDALVRGGPGNKFTYGSEDYSNYVSQYSPTKDREISNPKYTPASDADSKPSPRRLRHDAQVFGSGTDANKFHHGSTEHLAIVEQHSPKRTREVTECPKKEHVFISGSPTFHQTAGYASSYPGQIDRQEFGRSWPFQWEEKVLRETKDLFGNDRKPPLAHVPLSKAETDAIDKLMRESPRIVGNNHHFVDFKG
ncbi:hypothetical protein H310_13658 [Aphanomyces invadans]|uniref:Uncharacterized protein n=1 Tax=Aphanomyces invadans TaxID=157072 RepID=A0A024TCT9_9STRA|nr:hypothetical protein H310_13658 [Aphanomyces invadans]ETV91829.1 hypothetical protein H310_13658 [Aphanomyces invadans]|eukprot:XP_008879466.1 hypothetical protein H310_13658 [Aphanomyces invadans]